MTTEQLPQTEQQWGAPQQRPALRWSPRKTIAAVAIAVGVAAAGGAAIYAASGSSDASTSMQGGPGGGQMSGPGGQSSALTSALHGEFVVSDGNGGYTTELTQTGKVTAISSTSVTTQSSDGYSKTYTIGSGTAVSDITTGDTVTVVATVSGNNATVESLTEGTAAGQQQGALPRRDEES
ncbi:hypothetical protein FHX82_002880 [Amycolatopsis bartoniae]|uniref:DUF5666 domain-containing protein n=1 Tax=Amycolatopsis bartoniae TaxID=941986 RepID=A0A8H9IYY6_9PSEU|nr:hypothetical protein [Amycolatopsis bartoniae]MBB2935826.1 hypothetical protein [Amycolatopsis bartoniae]TVT04965.1 hypothetical protein FNH07_23280 [Amycolatopsis bartoniae]GHF62124.1 hypothetical protein GCM10017566_39550 [Amycolatopsis bartoniae]